jgi:uncharacterized membrane protein
MNPTNKNHQKALYFLSAFALSLSVGRSFYTGHPGCLFLVWNLFLAWVPYWISCYLFKPTEKLNLRLLLVFGCWIAFLPNAPYLLTDFVHLNNSGKLKWFDIVLFSSYATCGILLFHKSLSLFRTIYLKQISPLMGRLFTIAVLGVSAYGIYVGRVMRYNSWDVLTNPFGLGRSIFRSIFDWDHLKHTLYITSLFLLFLYISVVVFDYLLSPSNEEKN